MSEELEQLLKNLKLRRMLEIYEEQLRAAEKQDVSYTEFLTRLQFHVLTFFRGTVSTPESSSGTAKALVLNSE